MATLYWLAHPHLFVKFFIFNFVWVSTFQNGKRLKPDKVSESPLSKWNTVHILFGKVDLSQIIALFKERLHQICFSILGSPPCFCYIKWKMFELEFSKKIWYFFNVFYDNLHLRHLRTQRHSNSGYCCSPNFHDCGDDEFDMLWNMDWIMWIIIVM